MADVETVEKTAYEKLSVKHRAFVDTYIASNFNATRAARIMGYKFPNVEGSRLLVNASIAAAISERISEVAMSADEVMRRLANYARFDMSEFVRVPAFVAPPKDKPEEEGKEGESDPVIDTKSVGLIEPYVDVLALIEAGQGFAVKAIKITPNGANIEFHDPFAALQLIGKRHKLFVERHEHTGTDGKPIEFNSMVSLLAEQELDEWRKQQLVKISNTPSA